MKRLEMIDRRPVLLESEEFGDVSCYYLNLWGGLGVTIFSDDMSEEDLLKLLDIVTEFVNLSLEQKRKEQ